MLMFRNSPTSSGVSPSLFKPGKHWLVWRTDGKVAKRRKDSSLAPSYLRGSKKEPASTVPRSFFPFSHSFYSSSPLSQLPHTSATFILFYLLIRLVPSTSIHCPVANFSSFHALIRATRKLSGEELADKTKRNGETKWNTEKERERKNKRKIDCENSENTETSLFAGIPVFDECIQQYLRSLTIAGREGSIYTVNIWISSKDGIDSKSWKQIFLHCFRNSRKRSITSLWFSRWSFQRARVFGETNSLRVENLLKNIQRWRTLFYIPSEKTESLFSIIRERDQMFPDAEIISRAEVLFIHRVMRYRYRCCHMRLHPIPFVMMSSNVEILLIFRCAWRVGHPRDFIPPDMNYSRFIQFQRNTYLTPLLPPPPPTNPYFAIS